MIRFDELERLGAALAVMSDRSDGDCRAHDPLGDAGRIAFCKAIGIAPTDLVLARQVHGNSIAHAVEADRGRGSAPDMPAFDGTDAIITSVAGLPIGVTVADCVPVMLFEPSRRAAGIVHAGRSGTFSNICGRAVLTMKEVCGAEPAAMHAVVGPSAGPEAYEVSEAIAGEFGAAGLPVTGRRLNLWEANVVQLVQAGVPRSQIVVSGICTITDGRFHSHRAHAGGTRNLAILMI